MIYELKLLKDMSHIEDYLNGVVVRASSEAEARELAAKEHIDEGADAWTDPLQSSCARVFPDGPSRVVLCDISAH